MKNNKIYLDERGYQEVLQSIEELKKKIKKVAKEKGSSASDAVGDGWHDNIAFETAKAHEMMLISRYHKLKNDLERIVIVQKSNINTGIEIGTSFEIIFQDKSKEIFKLVSTANASEPNEISINSPLGRAVFNKKMKTPISYIVNNIEFRANIGEIVER